MELIRSPVNRENRDIEQQFQLLLGISNSAPFVGLFGVKKTSLKSPFESETKERRWEREEAEMEGKESKTASFGRDHDSDDESDRVDHDDGYDDDNGEADAEEEEDVDGG